MKSNKNHYQVIIIGGGVAGISAALWCSELGLKVRLFEAANEFGGQLLWTYNAIKNHLGIEVANGRELQEVLLKQIQPLNLNLQTNCQITTVNFAKKEVSLENGETFTFDSLVIATGIQRRKLNLENEEKFKEKGILSSGKRDGEKTKGKKVCIIGGGDAALENALIISEFAEKILIIHRRQDFRGRSEFIEKVKANKKIEILTETIVSKIIGDKNLEAIEIEDLQTKQKTHISTDFLLLRLGVEPNTKLFADQIKLDANGYCEIDAHCQTDLADVYAIGDVANPLAPTISGAIGMGANTAKIIVSKLN